MGVKTHSKVESATGSDSTKEKGSSLRTALLLFALPLLS
jgi:hypothetical protein